MFPLTELSLQPLDAFTQSQFVSGGEETEEVMYGMPDEVIDRVRKRLCEVLHGFYQSSATCHRWNTCGWKNIESFLQPHDQKIESETNV